MSKRRRRPNDFDLAKLILGATFLLSLAYTGDLFRALQLSLAILFIGGGLIVLGVFIWKSRRQALVPSSIRRPGEKQSQREPPVREPEQESTQQLERPARAETDKPVEWSRGLIQSLDWKRFEELCAAYFEAKGRKVKITDLGADGGIDLLLYGETDSEKPLGIVQCKAWNQKSVGVKEVRELLGLMTDMSCPLGVYITTSGYTPDAKAFANGKHIKLMDTGQLLKLIQELPPEVQTDLLQKTTSGDYTTPSCPSCGTKLVLRTSRKGKNAGQSFWGCPSFPRCRYTMPVRKSA